MSGGSVHEQALLTDMYQITMAYAYWKAGRAAEPAVFECYFRTPPFGGTYAICAGLDEVLAGGMVVACLVTDKLRAADGVVLVFTITMALHRPEPGRHIAPAPTRIAEGSRLPATLASSSLALDRGASILRVHDVAAHRQLLQVRGGCLGFELATTEPARIHLDGIEATLHLGVPDDFAGGSAAR